MRKQRKQSFAETLAQIHSNSVSHTQGVPSRLQDDGVLTDDFGRHYALVADGLPLSEATSLAREADLVVADWCGCQGGCGFDPVEPYEVARYIEVWKAEIDTDRRPSEWRSRITVWRASTGESMVMISAPDSPGGST